MNRLRITFSFLFLIVAIFAAQTVHGDDWSTDLVRVLLLKDYNTRVVVFGTTLLGATAGCIGTFLLLRRRALLGDAVSHATLPGIGIAFMIMVGAGGNGKWLPGLLIGALISGLLGMAGVLIIRRYSRVREDAALGIVLSVFFGAGVAILGIVQRIPHGQAAGLESFIFGKTASMISEDLWMIGVAAIAIISCCIFLTKEFKILCFDEQYAGAQGWPIAWLDVLMITMVVGVTVIGLQAVGLILIIAMLIIPAAAARFWTEQLNVMLMTSIILGGASGAVGSIVSALAPKLPAGAVIVLAASTFFFISMLFGKSRGLLQHWLRYSTLQRRVKHQHLLRAMYESGEQAHTQNQPFIDALKHAIPFKQLLQMRSWPVNELQRELQRALRKGDVRRGVGDAWHLTDAGIAEAAHIVRNHRLWEMYLITHADIAPSHVDRDADAIEHILSVEMISHLEDLLREHQPQRIVPASPHDLLNHVPLVSPSGGAS